MRQFLAIFLTALAVPFAGAVPCVVEWNGNKAALDSPTKAKDLSLAQSFLAEFRTSRETSLEITKRVHRQELSFGLLSSVAVGKALDSDAAALFDFENGTPKIYTGDSEFGVMVAVVFHEMVHATDDAYAERFSKWEAAESKLDAEYAKLDVLSDDYARWKKDKSQLKKQHHQMIFEAERLAFDGQQTLIEEIGERFACAKTYFKDAGEKKKLVVGKTSDAEIIAHYNLTTLSAK